jgi:hypothetical protein
VPPTKLSVEGRSCLHPLSLKVEFDKAVIDEEVGTHEVEQLPGGEMIANGGKTETRRDAAHSSQGTEKRSLGDTEAPSTPEDPTGLIVLGKIKRRVGVIAYVISHCTKKLDGTIDGVETASNRPLGILSNGRVVAIDDLCRCEVDRIGLFHNS